jgi:hypothetical protein
MCWLKNDLPSRWAIFPANHGQRYQRRRFDPEQRRTREQFHSCHQRVPKQKEAWFEVLLEWS